MQQAETATTALFAMQQPPPLINLAGLNNPAGMVSPRGRRRWPWIIIIVVVLLIILLGASFLTQRNRGADVTYQSGKVTQGNLVLTVNATGPLQSANYNLVFSGSGGKIEEINVTVGQQVKKDQVLARLDKTLLQDAVNQAGIAVGNAQASLNAAIASSNSSSNQSDANVSAAQTAVDNAQASLEQTQNLGDANVNSAQTALDNAQANLEQVMQTADLQKQSALDTYNGTGCNPAAPTPTPTPVPVPTGTPTPAPPNKTNCPAALDTYNLSLNQADASIAAAQAQVDTAQAALDQAQTAANTNNTNAQNQLNTANSQLNTTKSGVNVSQTSAQSQVTAAQAQLNTALGQLVQAQHNLDNATLKAPHDGIVTQINGTVGGTPGLPSSTGTLSGGTFIQIVDPSGLQVLANLNEADIANVQVGETVSFTVNAYGNQQFTGKVSVVPPFGQTISNVVTYPVTIDVDQSSLRGAHLLPSMTANVTVNTIQHNNVLLLPVNAVNFARLVSSGNNTGGTQQLISPQVANRTLNQARQMLADLEVSRPNLVSEGPIPAFIITRSGQQFVARPVVLGLTDGTTYEILQGLSLGDTFLVGTRG